MNKLRWALVVCCGLFLSGCQGQSYKGPKRYPLSGKITYDNEPVDAGNISFIPESGDQRVSGGNITAGVYTVTEADGANSGPYRVEIHWHKKTGRQFKDSGLNLLIDERKEGLPERFHAQSKLRVEVFAKNTKFDFDLKSQGD